jgi:P-type conjugative transfer protein TrbJ
MAVNGGRGNQPMTRSDSAHRSICRRVRHSLFAALVAAVASGLARPAYAQAIVFDPSNYSQNLLTAARALEQINNQLRGLDNQSQLLINSTKNVTGLPASVAGQLKAHIDEINRLMAQAKGLSFDVEKIISQFETAYPRQYAAAVSSDRMTQDATARSANSYEALKQALLAQSKIVEAIERDGATLQSLMTASSGAVGTLQAQQSGNELAGLQVKQALQLQTLLAVQARAHALKSASEQASAEAARERFVRFIGDGHAYAGQR